MIKEFFFSLFLHIFLGIFLIAQRPPTSFIPATPVMWAELKTEEYEPLAKGVKTLASEKSDIVEKIEKKEFSKEKKHIEKKKVFPEKLKVKPSSKKGISIGLETEIPYSYYLSVILQKVGENWSFPQKIDRDTLRTTVYFVILKTGQLTDIKIEKNSNDPIFDQSALRAVLLTGKLPPLPPETEMEFLKVHLEFQTP